MGYCLYQKTKIILGVVTLIIEYSAGIQQNLQLLHTDSSDCQEQQRMLLGTASNYTEGALLRIHKLLIYSR